MAKNFCRPLTDTDEHGLQVFMLLGFFKTPHGIEHIGALSLMADIAARDLLLALW